MPFRIHALAGALLVALAVPAAAQAVPTIEPLKPCYVTAGTAADPKGEGVEIHAQGFDPNSKVDMTLNGAFFEGSQGLQVGETGLLELKEFPAPFVSSGTQPFTVTLTQQGKPEHTVTATPLATRLALQIKPRRARPSQRIRFKGRGFTAEKPVYAHYVFDGKQRARVRMARRTGECGAWSVRKPQFPMRHPEPGRWIVQFDQSKRYRNGNSGKLNTVFVRVEITVTLMQG
jgi:hypothetical protein